MLTGVLSMLDPRQLGDFSGGGVGDAFTGLGIEGECAVQVEVRAAVSRCRQLAESSGA